MAKKKNKVQSSKLMYILAAVLGIVAIAMLFVPALRVVDARDLGKLGMDALYTGLQSAFGYATEDFTYLKFSFMNLLPYVLVIAGVVLVVLKLLNVLKNDLIDWVMVALFVVAGVFFFLNANFAIFTEDYTNLMDVANLIRTNVTITIGVGSIIAGITSVLAAVTVTVKKFLKK